MIVRSRSLVTPAIVEELNNFIASHGYEVFKDAVFNGVWCDYALEYIHPEEELRHTPGFGHIQKAFIEAIV